jgi:ribosomal protein S18 acetylase RimI-like enzyme
VSGGIRVRRFARRDCDAVRALCCDTANRGGPIDPVFSDRSLFADYWTSYYIGHEPRHVWVAETTENPPQVVGYLTAAFDTARFRLLMRRRVLPFLVLKQIFNGHWFKRESRTFLRRRLDLWKGSPGPSENVVCAYPAHLHLNVAASARSKGVGGALIKEFEREARDRVAGVHVETHQDSEGALRFFKDHGFREAERHLPFPKKEILSTDRFILVLVKSLGG